MGNRGKWLDLLVGFRMGADVSGIVGMAGGAACLFAAAVGAFGMVKLLAAAGGEFLEIRVFLFRQGEVAAHNRLRRGGVGIEA